MSYKHVSNWANRTKDRMIESLGGKCAICGYDKCKNVLSFHHLNPDEKEFGLGGIRGFSRSWHSIVSELRKCVLLCSNCHAEVHCGMTSIPKNATRFDETYADYKDKVITFTTSDGIEHKKYEGNINKCPICGGMKDKELKTCCMVCHEKKMFMKSRYKNISNDELLSLISNNSLASVGRMFGVSGNSIKKRCKKLGIWHRSLTGKTPDL